MNLDLIHNEAIEKLSQLRAGALFMHMGTGKTRVACELVKAKVNHFDRVAWLAPASLVREQSYHDEIRRWAGETYALIDFFTIEGVSQSDRAFLSLRRLAEQNKVFCVIDESITIKNLMSSRTDRLLKTGHLFEFRLLLNGTPVTRSLIDLYPQIQFLSPKILNMTEAQFASRFLTYIKEGHRPWQRWSRPENEAALIEMLRPYIFDSSLEIEAHLHKHDICFDLSDKENEAYSQLKQKILIKSDPLEDMNFLSIAQQLQGLYTLCSGKYEWLQGVMAHPKKTLIFVKFIAEADAVLDHIPGVLEYTGRHKDDLRTFTHGDATAVVMTYGTGGKGLNLQSATQVIFLGQTFDFGQKEHALHRSYRVGQVNDVEVLDCWVNTGLEELIRYSLDKKTSLSKNIKHLIEKEGIKAL